MNEQSLSEIRDGLCAEYLKEAGVQAAPVGFDPTILIAIIMAIFQLCKKSASEMKQKANSRSWSDEVVVQAATRRVFREEYGLFGYAKYNGKAAARAVMNYGKKAPLEQFQVVEGCCP